LQEHNSKSVLDRTAVPVTAPAAPQPATAPDAGSKASDIPQ